MSDAIQTRPSGIWIATVLTLAWWAIDVWATYYVVPMVHHVDLLSTTGVVRHIALLVGITGFWLMRWWGPLLIWTLSIIGCVGLCLRAVTIEMPEARITALGINTFVLLVWIVPTLIGAIGVRRRFKWW